MNASLIERIEHLSPQQRAVLEERLGQRAQDHAKAPEPTAAQRLVAYVVPYPGRTLTTAELRQYLRDKLPDYMVPSAFVVLESMPLTPNGKIDRRGLPEPNQSSRRSEAAGVSARTPVEEQLARVWMEVLRVERLGIHDNFFDLGGHSLLAIQVISRLRDLFQVEIPLSNFFNAPTVTGMAAVILQKQGEGKRKATPAIQRIARDNAAR